MDIKRINDKTTRLAKTGAASRVATGGGQNAPHAAPTGQGGAFVETLQGLIGGGDAIMGGAAAVDGLDNGPSINSVEALLVLQSIGRDNKDNHSGSHFLPEEQQILAKGKKLLLNLRNLQRQILEGSVAVDDLEIIAAAAAEHQGAIEDANLKQLIHNIELRSRVELAKMRKQGWGG